MPDSQSAFEKAKARASEVFDNQIDAFFNFKNIGDGISGMFIDSFEYEDEINNKGTIRALILSGCNVQSDLFEDGKTYAVALNNGHLIKLFKNYFVQHGKINFGDEVIIEFVATKDIGRPQPMKVYKLYINPAKDTKVLPAVASKDDELPF